MAGLRKTNNDLSIHQKDLIDAIYYLPDEFDTKILYKALKAVYGDDRGKEEAIKYLLKRHKDLPSNFDEIWEASNLTKYQEHDMDDYLNKKVYKIAKMADWTPNAFRKGKNTKKPPSKKKMHLVGKKLTARDQFEAEITQVNERSLPDEEKSFIPPHITNLNGACYYHPYMKKSDIPANDSDYLNKLTKIVDCEVIVEEAIEYLIVKPGQKEDDKEVRYRIRLTNRRGNEVLTEASFEELTTKTRFSTFLVSKGYVKFLGNNQQFDKFHEFVINEQDYPTVKNLTSWGEYKPGKFLFRNGLYDVDENQFYPADEHHRIRYHNQYLVCPSGSELVQPPTLSIPKSQDASSRFLAEKFELWESFNGKLNIRSTLGYAVACLYNQKILETDGAFPLLFKFGERGTGKSSSMDWFMALFGYKNGNRQSVSKQNTLKGMTRNMTLPRTFPFFLDDYRNHETNSQAPNLTSSILNWYHQIGTSMAKKSTDHQTIDTPMKASVVMTGNDKPSDPAALSRMIILNFTRFPKKHELELIPSVSQATHRFSEFSALIFQTYHKIFDKFKDYLSSNRKWLADKDFEGRVVNNWAYVLSGIQCIPHILPDLGYWTEEFEALRIEICQSIMREQALQKEANPLHEFLDALEYFSTQRYDPDSEYNRKTNVLDHRHFRCKVTRSLTLSSGEEVTGKILYISLKRIWQSLQTANADITRKASYSLIEGKLQNSTYYLDHGVQVPLTKSLTINQESNVRCYALNIKQLTDKGMLQGLIEIADDYELNRSIRLMT